jgi:hypothetical protein
MNDIPNLAFHEGLPDRQLLEELSKDNDHTLLVLDQLASKIVTSKDILHLFTVMSCWLLHKNIKGKMRIYITSLIILDYKYYI